MGNDGTTGSAGSWRSQRTRIGAIPALPAFRHGYGGLAGLRGFRSAGLRHNSRRIAHKLLRRETTAKGGFAANRKQAGWNDSHLLKVLHAIALSSQAAARPKTGSVIQ